MMKHFLLCLRGSQGVTIAFFDCIGRCVGTAPPTPRFAASICGFHRSGLRWFSPLGVAFASEIAARRVDASARRVGLRAHGFRFSACAASGLPLGGLAFGLTASAFRHAPLRSCPRRVGASAFRFGVCHSAGWRFRLPLRGCPRRVGASTFRFGVCRSSGWPRAHRFRFSACTASELPSAGWPSGSLLPIFGTRRFGVAAGRLAFGLPLPLFGMHRFGNCLRRIEFFRLPFRSCRSSGWPSGSLLPLFGMHRFGVAAGRIGSSAFRFGNCRWAGWPSGSLLPLFGMHRFGNCPRRVGSSAGRVGLRAHCFRFSVCTASEIALGGLALPPSASAFRHAPIRTAAPLKRGPTEHNDTTLVSLQNTYPNMLTYHIVRRKHFKTGKLLYYPQLVTPVADDHMHIIERIEKKCTLASADVKAVVDALEVEIIDSLRQGRSVRLGDLGSFRPTLRCSAGVGLPELAGVGQIKRVHVVFHPSSRIRRALSVKDHAVSFVQRDKKKHGANAQQGGSPTGGGTPGAPAPSTGSSAAGSAVTPPGTPVPATPSTGTPAGTPVPAAPSPTTSTPTGTPAAGSGTSAAGSAVTPPGTPVPALPSTGTPAGTPVPAAPSTGTPAGTPVPAAPSTGTPAGTPVPAAPSPTTSPTTGTPAPSTGTPAAGGA